MSVDGFIAITALRQKKNDQENKTTVETDARICALIQHLNGHRIHFGTWTCTNMFVLVTQSYVRSSYSISMGTLILSSAVRQYHLHTFSSSNINICMSDQTTENIYIEGMIIMVTFLLQNIMFLCVLWW